MEIDEALSNELLADLKALAEKAPPITLTMSFMDAWILLSQLQLALRHPHNTGPASERATIIGRGIENLIAVTPAMKQVIAMGWDPKHDHDIIPPGGA